MLLLSQTSRIASGAFRAHRAVVFAAAVFWAVNGGFPVVASAAAEAEPAAGDAGSAAGAIPADEAPAEPAAEEPRAGAKTLVASLTIFVLAIFVGFEVITKVPPTLHTPLMSGSNAISGITLVGALIAASTKAMLPAAVLGMCAVALATTNVVGGFLVTHRMLEMFRKK
jgi:NAD(P) transhydrogenase subunit alpha